MDEDEGFRLADGLVDAHDAIDERLDVRRLGTDRGRDGADYAI